MDQPALGLDGATLLTGSKPMANPVSIGLVSGRVPPSPGSPPMPASRSSMAAARWLRGSSPWQTQLQLISRALPRYGRGLSSSPPQAQGL